MTDHTPHTNGCTPRTIRRNYWMDTEALELMRLYCPQGEKCHGRFLSRLVYQHHERRQERARLAAAPGGCFAEGEDALVEVGALDE